MPLIKDWTNIEVNWETDEAASWMLNDESFYLGTARIRGAARMKEYFEDVDLGMNKSRVRWGYLVWLRRQE
jgi:hypothetical protein